MKQVVIIGGGAAGLGCGLGLAGRGLQVTLLEAAPRLGGRIGTEEHGPWRVEIGPATLQEGAPGLLPLIERVGLLPQVAWSDERADRRYLLRGGRLRLLPHKPPALLFSDVLPLSAKLRLLLEPWAPRAEDPDETVGAFVRRRLGRQVAEQVVDAVLGGIFAGDMDRLSLRSAFPRIAEMEREHGGLLRAARAMARQRKAAGPGPGRRLLSFQRGLGQLAEGLGEAFTRAGGRVLCGTRARALLRGGERATRLGPPEGGVSPPLGEAATRLGPPEGGDRRRTPPLRRRGDGGRTARTGWRVLLPDGELQADAVVLAVPPYEAQALCGPLDAEVAEAYAGIPMVKVAAVCLGWRREEVPHPLDGFGFLIPRREGVRLLGALFMTSALPGVPQAPEGHVLVRAMYGGAHDPGVVQLDDAAILGEARRDLQATLGVRAGPAFTHIQRWDQAIEQYHVGHAGRIATIEGRLLALGLFGTGAAFHGISVGDVLNDGQAKAEQVARHLAA